MRRCLFGLGLLAALVTLAEITQAATGSGAIGWEWPTTLAITLASASDTDVSRRLPLPPDLSSGGGGGFVRYIWAAYCFLLGAPLLVAGARLVSFTCGAGYGLVIALSLWVALVNSMPAGGYASTALHSDLAILIPTLAVSACALALGWLRAAQLVGLSFLCTAAGVALALQASLLRPGLLVPSLQGTWALLGGFALAMLSCGVWQRRLGIILASAINGAFLLSFGVDLVLEKEAGVSFGLRVILDGNGSTATRLDYQPKLRTQVTLAVGLGIMLLMAVCQHFTFPAADFDPPKHPTIWPMEPPSNRGGKFTPFYPFGRRVSAASSFEAITPEDLIYERPWTKMTPAAQTGRLCDSGGELSVDPIAAHLVPFKATRKGSYATISLHQDSPYALSAADLRAHGVALPAPALFRPHLASPHPPVLLRMPSSASSVSHYPPTPSWQTTVNPFDTGMHAPGVERRDPPERRPFARQSPRYLPPSRTNL